MPTNPKAPPYQTVWKISQVGTSPHRSWKIEDAHGTDVSSQASNTREKCLQFAAEEASKMVPPQRISIAIDTGGTGASGEIYLILDPK